MTSNSKPLFYIIAGEPSGDLLGARLIKALQKETDGACSFAGIGGEEMCKQDGFESLFDIKDLAIMGFFEVISSIPAVLKRIDQTLKDIEEKQPTAIITIDSWGFTGRINTKLAKIGSKIPRIHYVAPQVWAWKKGRAKTMGQKVDHLLALLPNEPAYFEKYGLDTTYVGHPVIEGGSSSGDGGKFKKQHNIANDAKVLCVLPGSRRNETQRLLPVFKDAAKLIANDIPNLHVVIPTVKTVSDYIGKELADWNIPHTIVMGENNRYDAFAASDAAIAASGTVALELAIAKVPHTINYKVAPMTYVIVKMFFKMKFVNLTNIMLDELVIPELLQNECTPEKIYKETMALINEGETRDKQLQKMQEVTKYLSPKGEITPSHKAAQTILEVIKT
jgi:lipid-A-disaccharide synthase